jgi:hypothetical protein
MTLARTPRAPTAGSAWLVQRSPCVVSTTVGFSLRPALRRTEARRSALSCAWPAFEASDRKSPLRARRREAGTHGFSSPTTHTGLASPVTPGVPPPGTFRPQGLSTLSTACSSPCPAAARRPQRRPWGSPFRVLLLPASATPFGASPLLSFPGMTEAMPARLQRFIPAREGERAPARRRPHKPYPPGCSPLQGFRLRHRGRGFPRRAPRVAGPRELPTVPLPDAASGDC